MKTETESQLLDIIYKTGPLRPVDIAKSLDISLQMVHRHLKKLLQQNKIKRLGSPPKVYYQYLKPIVLPDTTKLEPKVITYIEENYLILTPSGERLFGIKGFLWWSKKTNQLNLGKLALEYMNAHQHFQNEYNNKLGSIDATFKIHNTFKKSYLNKLFYYEFYSLPKFGKTKSGQLVYLGKSGQNISAIKQLVEKSKDTINKTIKHYRIDAVAFAPHSIPRKIQFLDVFKKKLGLNLPLLLLDKIFVEDFPVSQKSLSKLNDRIENAESTIFPNRKTSSFNNILVIDDAVGSGATLNIIAKKLKLLNPKAKVYGFALTGSLKGFEVINEI
ncbi:MAG: winged helix-turn-helix transcriptional regulator [Bdellovibrionaceae bacterium]|jgi:hypothetical protein|nr:winged helix-turn-helix transcriptional regulator [Pseudobdellovibrionaceae bacterium]